MSSGKKRGMPPAHGSEVNVTPLIDVIMCLIIFFMLVAKIGVTRGETPVDLATASLARSVSDAGPTLTLNLVPLGDPARIKAANPADRELATEMQIVTLVNDVQRDVPIRSEINGTVHFPLREVLVGMKQRYRDEFKVIVRADADLPFTLVEQVLVECANAGTKNLLFATKSPTASDDSFKQ